MSFDHVPWSLCIRTCRATDIWKSAMLPRSSEYLHYMQADETPFDILIAYSYPTAGVSKERHILAMSHVLPNCCMYCLGS